MLMIKRTNPVTVPTMREYLIMAAVVAGVIAAVLLIDYLTGPA